jgi:hypothetical protein
MAAVADAGLLREQVDFFAHALLAVMNEFAMRPRRRGPATSTVEVR